MDPISLISQFLNKAKGKLGDSLGKMVPTSTYSDMPQKSPGYKANNPAPQASAVPQAQQAQPALAQQATQPTSPQGLPVLRGFGGAAPISGEQLASLIAQHRGADTPILQNLSTLINAGNQLPSNLDPLLPIVLAIRETQGGRYNKGQNNPYNIRGIQGDKSSKFIDYPSVDVASQGGQNGPDVSQGLTGLLGKNPIYSDFRQSGKLQDLFAHYSPTADSNGSLDQQAENYKWIRNQILGLSQGGGSIAEGK